MEWFRRRRSTQTAETRVTAVIDSIMNASSTEAQVEEAFVALEGLDAADVIAEMFWHLEDVTAGVELDALIDVTEIPLPDHPREIVDAVRTRDMKALEAVTSTDDLNTVVSAIINLIVAFKDARQRL